MKPVIVAFVMLFVLAGTVQAQALNVKLSLNNVQNNVYIPGTGEVASDSLGPGSTYATPDNFYIASYFNNLMYALVAATGTSLRVSNDMTSHNITINQNIQGSKVLLGFTDGDYNDIDMVISSIEDGTFWLEIAPSLSFGLGYLNPVKVLLSYTDINITGNIRLHSGFRKLIISNMGYVNNKPIIEITSP
jgi:hypothetical protein